MDPKRPIGDDPTIPVDALLLRRIYPNRANVTFDENLGDWRPSSLAFDDPPEMSAFIEAEASVAAVMRGHEDFGLVRVPAQLIRDLGFPIVREEIDVPGHVIVRGNISRTVRGKVAKASAWVIRPKVPDSESGHGNR